MKFDNRVFDLLWLAAIGFVLFLGDFRRQQESGETGNYHVVKPHHASWATLTPNGRALIKPNHQLDQ